MKIEITDTRPIIKSRGIYAEPVKQFVESDKKYIVFRFDDEEDNYESARNSIHVVLERQGYSSKVRLISSRKDKIICLEKKA